MATSEYIVVNPAGEVVAIPSDHAREAAAQGFTQATAEQIAAFQRRDALADRYGTPGQTALAGAEAGLRASTLGGFTALERLLGIDPAGIAAREEVNPVAAGVGTGVGIAAPLILTGGGSAVAQGGLRGAAALSGPALAARGGAAVTDIVGTALARSAVPKIAQKALATGAGSAVEGAAYGAGQVVHEASLGDPNLTAQSALAKVGLGAALGGGAGLVFGTGAGVLTRLSGVATRGDGGAAASSKLAEWLGEVKGARAIKAAGGIQSDIGRVEKQIGQKRLNELGQEMFDLGLVGPTSTPARTAQKAEALQRKAGEEIGSVLREADAAAKPEQFPRMADVLGRARVEVLDPLKQNPLQQEAANRLEAVLLGYDVKFSAGLTFKDLHGMRRQIDDALYGLRGNQDPFASAFKDALHDLRGIVSKELDDGVGRVGLSTDAWKTAKRQYEVASRALEFAEKGMQRAGGNNLVPLSALMTGLGGGVATEDVASGVGFGMAALLARRHASGFIGKGAGFLKDALTGRFGAVTAKAGVEAAESVPVLPAVARPPGSRATRVITPQRPTGEAVTYDVVEADDLIASHSPTSFAKRRDYPAGIQERQYHSLQAEWRKVQKGGDRLNPALVLADTPTAVDGPPLVTAGDRRIVLGGNGRTMMMQRAFKDAAAREAYRQELLARAGAFGVSTEKVGKMKAPVLVRVVDDLPATAGQKELAAAVRRYNEGLTQELSGRAKAVSEAQLLRPATVQSIGDLFADAGDKSLRDLMRERPLDFVAILQRDGLINETNRAAKVAGENLTDEAKDWVEGMFLGRVVGTGDRLAQTAPSVLKKVERATPHLIRVQGINPGLDEIPTLQAALDLMNDAARRGMTVDQLLSQGALFGAGAKADPTTLAMVSLLNKEGQLELGARFAKWARLAAVDPRQGLMFSKPPTTIDSRRALLDGLGLGDEALAQKVLPEVPAAAVPEPPPPQPPETVAALAAIERATNDTRRQIRVSVSTLLRAGVKAGNIARHEVVAGLPKVFGERPERAAALYAKQAEQIRLLAQSPEALLDAVEAATDDVQEHAPETAQALAVATARGVSFLASKLPEPPDTGPLGPKLEPSPASVAKFFRYAEAVDDPLGVLKQASAGTLTPEAVEAVQTVYPELYVEMQAAIVEKLTSVGEVPFRSRLMLSMLLGQDVDGSFRVGARNLPASPAVPQSPSPPSAARADRLKLADRMRTPLQRSADRD